LTVFFVGVLVLMVALGPCAWVCWRGRAEDRLVALGLTGTVQSLILLFLAVGFAEPALASLGAVLAVMSTGGTLAFARFLERWVWASLRDVVAIVLLAFGLAVIVASCVGIAVLDEPMDRLHLVTPASTLGVTAACAAVVAREGLDASGTAALLLAAITVLTSPLVSHACARSIEVRKRAEETGAESAGLDREWGRRWSP
jgi:multisubunit Na+/H+ antiporter MnhG subunit